MARLTQKDALDILYKAREPRMTDLLDEIDAAIATAATRHRPCALVYTPFVASEIVNEVLADLKKRSFKAVFLADPTAHFVITF